MPSQPNVLFVLCDQLSASWLGCYGDEQVSTPTIDGFASEGLRFENAYTPHPVCTPARGSLQTGTLKFDHQACENWSILDTHPDRPTLARSFGDAGYQTGYIGKWHLDGQTGHGATFGSDEGDESGFVPPGPRRAGYDYWRGFNTGHDHDDGHPMFTRDGELYLEREDEWQATVETDMAQEFISWNSEEPFFLFLSYGPPHWPYNAPGDYADNYPPEEIELPPNVPEEVEEEAREKFSEYYGMIEAIDDEFERLLGTLEDEGIADDTLVVFTADHGDMMGCHGKFGKGNPNETSANVPLLMRYPGVIEAGRTSSGLVSLADYYPTLASLCDIPMPDRVEGTANRVKGTDFSDHVRGEAPEPDEPVFMVGQGPGGWRAIRSGSYTMRLAEGSRGEGLHPETLYDVENDPHEQENLVETADPELLGELLSRLIEQAYRYRDSYVMGESFRHDASWGPEFDEEIVPHIDIDYERYAHP